MGLIRNGIDPEMAKLFIANDLANQMGGPGGLFMLRGQGAGEPDDVPASRHAARDRMNAAAAGLAGEFDEVFAVNRHYIVAVDLCLKHGLTVRFRGQKVVMPRPTCGQYALNNSFGISDNTDRRIGIDPTNNQIVVLDKTGNLNVNNRPIGGIYHGHVRTRDQLEPSMLKALNKHGVTVRKDGPSKSMPRNLSFGDE